MAFSADALNKILSTPTLKGFIEVFPSKDVRILVSIANITGIRDQGADKGCIITLNSAVLVHAPQDTLYLDQPYPEVLELLKQAQ